MFNDIIGNLLGNEFVLPMKVSIANLETFCYTLFFEGNNIMDNITRLQLSAFVQTHIEPNDPKDLQFLMNEFNNLDIYTLLPSPMLIQTVDVLTQQPKNTSQLAFFTPDQSCQIVCLDNRIDITLNQIGKGSEISFDFAQKALQIIMRKYSIYANRLALNVDTINPSFSGDFRKQELKSVFSEYFKEKSIIDWATNVVIRENITINNTNEELNIITTLNTIQNINTNERAIACHLDVSTAPENSTYRLKEEHIKEFSDKAFSFADEIAKSISEFKNDL